MTSVPTPLRHGPACRTLGVCKLETKPKDLPPVLEAVYGALSPATARLLTKHLLGGTSADWLAKTLRDEGFSVSASSIRTYRRSLEGGV